MPMHNKKSLTERVLELKEKYLQPANIIQKIKKTAKNTALITITSAMLLGYTTSVLSSESINVNDYIQQYNFPAIVQMYLKPLEELDQSEKEFIDLLQDLPEDKQKDYAKDIYKNKSLTPELLEKIKQEQTAEKPITIDDKIDKITQKPENPVDIYAVIANGADDENLRGCQITSMLSFYRLLKDVGVSDDNITFFLYQSYTKDIIHTRLYEIKMKGDKETREDMLKNFPSDKSEVSIDFEKFKEKDVLKSISKLNSDNNDFVYILLASHGTKSGKLKFLDGYIESNELKRQLKKVDGTIILMIDSCYSGKFLKNLGYLDNYIGIASAPEDSLSGGGGFPYYLIRYFRKDNTASISKLVEDANNGELKRLKFPPMVIFPNKNAANIPLIPLEYNLKTD
ncbi:hypothetical protein FP803_03020 [Candidatus Woesearchaeota archaeon]|nr:hypothetical protein [Candidatus Woesearchaeota archaeon]